MYFGKHHHVSIKEEEETKSKEIQTNCAKYVTREGWGRPTLYIVPRLHTRAETRQG